MSKTSYAAMSLIAAIPALFLCYLMAMAFLSHADKMSGPLNATAGVILLLSAAVAIIPVGIMIGGGKKFSKVSQEAAAAAVAAPAAESVEDLEVDDSLSGDDDWADSEELDASDDDASDSEFMESEDFEAIETNEFQPSEEAVETVEVPSEEFDGDLSDEFEFDDNLSDEFDVDFDFDDDDEIK